MVPVPSGAGSTAASVGGKRTVDDLAVGVKVASRAEGTVAVVGWEWLKWKRSFGCVRGRIDGVGVGDTETVREYELKPFDICERFCSA